jgi:hypothetical protein
MNQTQLAHLVLCSKSHISDIELEHVLATSAEIQLLEQALDADGVLSELYDLLNIGVQESATVADAEHDAIGLTDWESRVMPGLLQTPDYNGADPVLSVPAAAWSRFLDGIR